MDKSTEQRKNAIEVQVQQHKKTLNMILILLLLLTANVFVLSSKLNSLIRILDNAIQKIGG